MRGGDGILKDRSERDAGLDSVRTVADATLANVSRAIVNTEYAIRLCLATLICDGHLLIEDVPGVATTILAKSLARSPAWPSRPAQFTPDLLPPDLTRATLFNQK